MKKRWQLSDNGTSWRECFPVNGNAHKINEERDLEIGLIAFRKKLTSGLVFINDAAKNIDDYSWIRSFADSPSQRCVTLYVRLQLFCSGSWQEEYRGKFSAGSCKWELGPCIVTVKPDTVDKYTCLIESMKVKRNILQAGVVDAYASLTPSIEWTSCIAHTGLFPGDTNSICVPTCECTDADDIDPTHWWLATAYTTGLYTLFGAPVIDLFIYWREFIVTECVGGSPVAPPGTGWVLFQNDCGTTGLAKYVRQPTISFTYSIEAGTCDAGSPVEPATSCAGTWINLLPCGYSLTGIDYPPYFVCYTFDTQSLNRARTLESAVEYIIDKAGCSLGGVRSDFFDWDPPGDATGYSLGINYITGVASQVNHLLILQKSDVINPSASNPATIGEMTFLEMMTALRIMFRVYWDIDDDGFVRIEHWNYWRFNVGLDLPIMYDARVNEPLTYDHLGEEIPRIERGLWMEAQGRDFVGRDIVYSGPCVNSDSVKEWTPGKITTDVTFILAEPTAISKDGFVILACYLDSGGVYQSVVTTGAITANAIANGPLSWANLERDFWTWDRYQPSGNMNGVDTVFDGFLPTIEQEPVTLDLCCEMLDFNPSERVNSTLGDRLGVDASVDSVTHDLATNRTRLTLRYAY